MIRIASILLSFALTALPAAAFETIAKSAIVLDVNTNQTLMEKNADMALPPASMSKLMTLYMTFEALSDGRWTLDKRVPVSEFAASFGGSTMFLEPGDRPTVEELIRGVIVLSGNDSSVALGEAMAGSASARFASHSMTEAPEAMKRSAMPRPMPPPPPVTTALRPLRS